MALALLTWLGAAANNPLWGDTLRGEPHKLRWVNTASVVRGSTPHARGGAAVTRHVLNDQDTVYLFGGCDDEGTCYDELHTFDQTTNRWSTLQDAKNKPPSARRGHTINVLGTDNKQRLYVWGGWRGIAPVKPSLKYFDIHTRSWGLAASGGRAPDARWAHTATAIHKGAQMIVFGGEGTENHYYNDLHLLDATPDAEKWYTLGAEGHTVHNDPEKRLPPARLGHTATLLGSAIYVFGGYGHVEGARNERTALGDLWVLDLSRGIRALRWIDVHTVGKAPVPRAFHAAAAGGTNLFVTGGCDEGEWLCHNDGVFVLDTTYPDGMRWRQLPVSHLRPHPSQAAVMWVGQEGTLWIGEGCVPPLAAKGARRRREARRMRQLAHTDTSIADDEDEDDGSRGEAHCSAEFMAIHLGILLDGATRFNVSSNGTVVESAALAADDDPDALVERDALAHTSSAPPSAELLEPAAPLVAKPAANGTAANATDAADASVAADAMPEGAVVTPESAAIATEQAGMHTVSNPTIGAKADGRCTEVNLSRCESTTVAFTVPALAKSLAVVNSGAFQIGRFIRINPHGETEEDARIVGFGRRLTASERRQLSYAVQRDVHARAVERQQFSPGGRHAELAPPRMRAGVPSGPRLALLQLGERQRPLVPPPNVVAELEGGRETLSRKAAERVHGRLLQPYLNISTPLQFAHEYGEEVVMLPYSVHNRRPAPAMQHLRPGGATRDKSHPIAAPIQPAAAARAPVSAAVADDAYAPSPPRARRPPPPPSGVGEEDEEPEVDYGDEPIGPEGGAQRSGAQQQQASNLSGDGARDGVIDRSAEAIARAVGNVPTWAWVILGLLLGISFIRCLASLHAQRAASARRRRAYEDVQPVFQTETWRKMP